MLLFIHNVCISRLVHGDNDNDDDSDGNVVRCFLDDYVTDDDDDIKTRSILLRKATRNQ